MSVAFDARTASSALGGGSSKSFSHVPVGTPDGVLCGANWIHFPSGNSVLTATYASASMTEVRPVLSAATGAGPVHTHTYKKESPASGTQTAAYNWNVGSNYGACLTRTTTGNDTSNMISTSAEASGTSSAPTVSLATTSGNYCFDSCGAYTASAPTATLTGDMSVVDSGTAFSGGQRTAATGGTVNFDWTGSQAVWVIQAFEIAAAGGGPTYTLTAAQASYALTGQSSGLKASRVIAAAQQTYALTGNAAALKAGRKLTASQQAYTLTGNDANLSYTPAVTYTLSAGSGSFSLSGQSVSLRVARKMTAASASFLLAGSDVGLIYSGVQANEQPPLGNTSWHLKKKSNGSFASRTSNHARHLRRNSHKRLYRSPRFLSTPLQRNGKTLKTTSLHLNS